MGLVERRAREKEELRSKILEATTELLIKEGYQGVSIRKIADKIEYAPSTIYLYFKDKTDLVHAICEDTFLLLTEAMDELAAKPLPPLEKLRACLRCYIDFGLSHPNHYIVTLCTPEQSYMEFTNPEAHARIMQAGMGAFDRLRQGLAGCMAAGAIRPDDVETTSQSVWAMIHGLTSVLVTMEGGFPFVDKEILIRSTIDRIIRSLV